MTFKIKATIFSFLLIAGSAFGQQAEKTLVKSFNIDGEQEVILDLPGEVEVKHWNNKVMRVQMTISLGNGSVPMLKSLISAGRYNLDTKTDESNYTVYAPNIAREIKLRGEPLKEKIAYTVFSPEHVTITLSNNASASTEEKDTDASL